MPPYSHGRTVLLRLARPRARFVSVQYTCRYSICVGIIGIIGIIGSVVGCCGGIVYIRINIYCVLRIPRSFLARHTLPDRHSSRRDNKCMF